MIREERRRKQRLVTAFKVTVIVLSVILILVLVAINAFRVKKVVVEGNELYDQNVIEKAVLNDQYSWNSLYVFFKYKFVDTEQIPFIDTMEISLKDPQTLHIMVYEKGMMGYIYISGISENAYFDKDGFVVETSSDEIENVPLIKGIECNEVVLYEKLPIKEEQLKKILLLTQALKRSELVPKSITYGGPNEPVISYGKVQVTIGDISLLTQKVERIAAIMPSLKGKKGMLHLENWTEESTNIVFEKK